MTWVESTCPICDKNTSGSLPYRAIPLYVQGKLLRVNNYPCEEHIEVVSKFIDHLDKNIKGALKYLKEAEKGPG